MPRTPDAPSSVALRGSAQPRERVRPCVVVRGRAFFEFVPAALVEVLLHGERAAREVDLPRARRPLQSLRRKRAAQVTARLLLVAEADDRGALNHFQRAEAGARESEEPSR